MGKSIEEWKIGDPMINERDYWQDPNYVAPDKEKEKMVLKLASIITDRYVKKFTGTINNRDPEYWMLDMILTKEQVRFLLNFKKTRVPYTIRELARINKMSIKHTKDMVKELCWIGVVEMTREGEDKHKEYNLPIFVPGSAEFMMMQPALTDKFPQLCMRGEGSGEVRGEFCIACGDLAEYEYDRGIGRNITREEVYEILERAERHGYVHQITNIDGEDKIVAICNCAVGVCNALRTSQLYNTPNMSASAYRAHVEKEKCVACGKCVEVCPVGAAKLGQKLCKKDGSAVAYPKSELPNAKVWGPDKWNYNYREDVRIHCYDTGTSPCKTACPAHLAIQGYIKMASEGRFLDALKLIKQDNPLPAVCGAVCNRRCEDACTRGTIDQPLAIDEIKKYIAALDLNSEERYIPFCEKHDGGFWGDEYKIAVIGAGPAGLSAAYYLRLNGYPVTVFEKNKKPGGMLTYGIPSYRLEKDVIDAEVDVIREMGVEFKCGVEIGKDITIEQLRKEGYKAFFVAIGAQGGRLAGVPGEDAEGVETGVDFLRRNNHDHESATLTGDTVVIGGGNVAVDVDEMPAAHDEVEEAKEEGICVINGWGPKEILTENGHVTGVLFKKCTSVKDADGRFNPQYSRSSGETSSLAQRSN